MVSKSYKILLNGKINGDEYEEGGDLTYPGAEIYN